MTSRRQLTPIITPTHSYYLRNRDIQTSINNPIIQIDQHIIENSQVVPNNIPHNLVIALDAQAEQNFLNMADNNLAEALNNGIARYLSITQTEPPIYNHQIPFHHFLNLAEQYMQRIGVVIPPNNVDEGNAINNNRKAILYKYLGSSEQSAMTSIDPNGELNYAQVREALLARFGIPENSEKSRQIYAQLKQEPYETLDQFADKVRTTTNLAFANLPVDQRHPFMLDKFTHNVRNPFVKEQLLVANDATLDVAVQRAKRMERVQQELGSKSSLEINYVSKTDKKEQTNCSICDKKHLTQNCHFNLLNKSINRCKICLRSNHATDQCKFKPKTANVNRTQNNQVFQNKTYPNANVCGFCGIRGHIMMNCFRYQKQGYSKNGQVGPMMNQGGPYKPNPNNRGQFNQRNSYPQQNNSNKTN